MRWCTLGLFKNIPIYLTWVVQATLLGISNQRFDLLGCASALNNLWRKKWQISSVEAGLGYLNLYLTIWLTWVVPTPRKAFSNRRFDWLADWLGSVSAWNFYFEEYKKGFSNRRFDLLGCASAWTTYLPEWDVYLVSK